MCHCVAIKPQGEGPQGKQVTRLRSHTPDTPKLEFLHQPWFSLYLLYIYVQNFTWSCFFKFYFEEEKWVCTYELTYIFHIKQQYFTVLTSRMSMACGITLRIVYKHCYWHTHSVLNFILNLSGNLKKPGNTTVT